MGGHRQKLKGLMTKKKIRGAGSRSFAMLDAINSLSDYPVLIERREAH